MVICVNIGGHKDNRRALYFWLIIRIINSLSVWCYTCIKNESSYSTSLLVDEAYRQVDHDSDDKCECVFARVKGRARLYTGQLCKVERRKILRGCRSRWERNYCRMDVNGDQERREKSRRERAVSNHYLIRSTVSEMGPLINIIYDVNFCGEISFPRDTVLMILLLSARLSFAFLFNAAEIIRDTYRKERKNRRDESSCRCSPALFFAIAFKSCIRILRVISSSRRQRILGQQREREKERDEEEAKRMAFHMAYVIHHVCYLITAFAPRLAEPSSNDRAQWRYRHF